MVWFTQTAPCELGEELKGEACKRPTPMQGAVFCLGDQSKPSNATTLGDNPVLPGLLSQTRRTPA